MRSVKLLPLLLVAGLAACQPPPTKADLTAATRQTDGYRIAQATTAARVAPASQAQVQISFAPVAARAAPAVVNVYAQRVTRSIVADPRFAQFGLFYGVPREQIERSLGSGVLVRADGVIVTNHHVVDGADSLKVVLSDRREFDAKLLLDDARSDLAVLRIDAKGARLPTLPFADTRSIQVGDLVLAIGNPFGLQQTVTSGIVSALARTDVGINDFSFFIQTDAAINRGNSGGALVDMAGDLVGINTAIFSQSGDSNGIGFAIPAEMVKRVVESAVSGGKLVRPWLGVKTQAVTQDLAKSLGLDSPKGVLVSDLYPGGAADRAGLKRGDVILAVNASPVFDDAGVRYQAATQKPGGTIRLDILRGAQRLTLAAPALAAPRAPAPDPREFTALTPLQGAHVVTLSPAQAEDLGLDGFATGVVIDALNRAGAAARVGLAPGDVIRDVNGQTIRTSADLERALKAGGTVWRIGYERNGERATIEVRG
jgi:Do/DeqQ family serine protease